MDESIAAPGEAGAPAKSAELAADPAAEKKRKQRRSDTAGVVEQRWDYSLLVFPHPLVLWDFLRFMALILAIMQLLILAIGIVATEEPVLLPLEVIAAILGGAAVLFAFVMVVFFGNRYHMSFALTPKQVACDARLDVGLAYRILMILYSLFNIFTFLAMLSRRGRVDDREEFEGGWTMPWSDVRWITVHRWLHVITLSSSWLSAHRLYIPGERFDGVLELVQSRVEAARAKRASRPERPTPVSRWTVRLVVWAGLAGAATVAVQAWEGEITAFPAFLAGSLVLVASLMRGRWRQWASIAALVGSLFCLWMLFDMSQSEVDRIGEYFVIYGYMRDPTELRLAFGGALALTVMSLVALVRFPGGDRL